jgi:hypothetical protein
MAQKVVAAVNRLRDMELAKPPGVSETLDWVSALDALGAQELTAQSADDTLGSIVKDRDDLELVRTNIQAVVAGG